MNNFYLRTIARKSAILCGLLSALSVAAPAFANPDEVSKLMRAGQYAEALKQADAFLARNPRDAQMRFMKGVILTEQNKTSEAIAVFTRLTEDYPTLPEPYNNLAVLYAAAGQYEKARNALDAAIRTNPSYATAYENLGDVHAKLASQAYDKALQLDSANSAAKSKLTLVRSLVGGSEGSVVAAAPAASVASAPPAKTPASKPETALPPVAQAPASKPEPAPKVEEKAVKPEPKREPKADSKPASGEQDAVIAAVNAWVRAWERRDMKNYFGAYRSDFSPPGQPRRAWEEERRSRIVGRDIDVRIEGLEVSVDGRTATARFQQFYRAGSLRFNTRKTLILNKQGSRWLISQERTGN